MAPGAGEQAVLESLARIAERDPAIRAWLHVDSERALDQARRLDGEHGLRGPLHGVPIGVKDVFDTFDMPTTHNSPLYEGHQPAADAACVQTLRAAGAIILGKTDTTEFAAAGRDAATANPHDPTRTPGGSSAGSAAAVADGHVRIALATQTGGSTIRPASFCGVYGFKPTWGLVSREGVKLYANSLDTVGWHARSIQDCDLLCETFGFAPPSRIERPGPLRLALCRTPFWDHADAEVQAALVHLGETLADLGVEVRELELPSPFETLNSVHKTILFREGAAAFLNLARSAPDRLHKDFHDRVASLGAYDDQTLRRAYDVAAEARSTFEALAAPFDAVLCLSAPSAAPVGRGPGDPVLNQLWTLLHAPVVSLPLAKTPQGLPIGVSLVAARFEDRRLLRVAREVEALLADRNIRPTCENLPPTTSQAKARAIID
jgi:Asp-tRNA(Asn)/Glu-tRNA(Gln) amidotransferase A subunit family amidase